MDKFQDKFRISSNRLHNWDYSKDGIYFITIVIQNRDCILGKIENNKMILSEFGNIVNDEWIKSFKIRDELFLDEFVIMPNHLHALAVIKNHNKIDFNVVETHGRASLQSNPARASLPPQPPPPLYRKPKSISSFIAGFKSSTSSKIDDYIDLHNLAISKFNRVNKLWQANYHDHIVRNKEEYWRIKQYIKNNPAKWKSDELNNI